MHFLDGDIIFVARFSFFYEKKGFVMKNVVYQSLVRFLNVNVWVLLNIYMKKCLKLMLQ